MSVSYTKLWKMLIDRNMKKKDLAKLAGVSNTSLAKMKHNQNITMDVLDKICIALECNIGDVVDITKESTD